MFCTNCGKQLPDNSRFCIYCGSVVGGAVPPVQEAPQAPVQEAPVYEAPVYEAPVQEVPVYQAPVQEPQYQEPIFEEPQYQPYQQPVFNSYNEPPVTHTPKKKKKKTGLIIAIVLVVIALVAAGVVGYLLYTEKQNQEAYTAAEDLLTARDYEGALEAFEALGDYDDAADRAAKLEQLQADYNAAVALVSEHRFGEASTAFSKLGDYRDSKEYKESKITYAQGTYFMDCARNGDTTPITEILGEGTAMEQGSEIRHIYGAAAAAFAEIPEYADAAELCSECLLNVALILLEQEDFDQALEYIPQLNDEDSAALNEAYLAACADGEFLADIAKAFDAWYDYNGDYDFATELENAYAIVNPYVGEKFDDSSLKDALDNFIEALDTMYYTTDNDGSVFDWVTYYEGMAQLYAVADDLQFGYNVFSGNVDYMDWFVGYSDYYAKFPSIEQDIIVWYNAGITAYEDDDGIYYTEYTNTSGYAFTLNYYTDFYDAYDTYLDSGEIMEIHVGVGETVYLPIMPSNVSIDDCYTFEMEWWFYPD